jgi:hypothetical protein
MEMSNQLHAPADLPQENSHRCPLYTRLGVPQSSSGEEKDLLVLPGIELRLLGRPARSLVAIPASVRNVYKFYFNT